MYADVVLPNLGFGMEEGRLVAWLKTPGEAVRKGEALAEIEGDKATVELEAVVDGVLEEIRVAPDTVVPVGAVLARIRTTSSAAASAPQLPSVEEAAPKVQPKPAEPVQASPVARRLAQERGIDLATITGSGPGGRITREDVETAIAAAGDGQRRRVLAAPAVRKLARDRGVDLTQVRSTGPEGRVTRADLEAFLAAFAPQPVVEQAVYTGERQEAALSPIRKTIARRLAHSMQEMPHFYVSGELDFTSALTSLPQEIGVNALLLYLTVRALKDVPELNATYEDGHLYHYPHVSLAIAVARPDGLIAPVLHGAEDYSLAGIANRARDLVARAREGRLKPDELQGGTFTISNLGIIRQIDQFTAIINPPQVGILAVGAIKERPVVIDGGLHVRTTGYLTVSADHRIVDGLVSARFVEAFDKHLQAFAG